MINLRLKQVRRRQRRKNTLARLRQKYAAAGHEGKEKILAKVRRVSPTVTVEEFKSLV